MSTYVAPTIEAQLEQLKKQRDAANQKIKDKDQEVSSRQKELEEAKSEQAALAEQIATLERTQNDITKVQEQVAKMRDGVVADLTRVSELCAAVTRGLERVDQNYLNQVRTVRVDVDGAIAQLKQDVSELEKKVKPAEAAAEAARKAAREADYSLADAQKKLQSLPAEIQAAKAEITRIKSAMESAYSKGPLTEAFLQMLDLEIAIHNLSELISSDTVNSRVQQVKDSLAEAARNKEDMELAAKDLAALKADLAKKEKEAVDAAARRKTEITTQVVKIGHPNSGTPVPASP